MLIQRCLDRLRGGDPTAREELFRQASLRLERLAHRMLADSPNVRRWEETADVLQNAVVRLCRALDQIAPETVRDFIRLAALQIRRELVDLVRHYYGPHGLGANYGSVDSARASGQSPAAQERAALSWDPSRLASWTEFHTLIESLPDDEREVFDLLWYHGLTQDAAAAVVGVSVRTIKSRWRSARLRLHKTLGGAPPGI